MRRYDREQIPSSAPSAHHDPGIERNLAPQPKKKRKKEKKEKKTLPETTIGDSAIQDMCCPREI
ncbi:hypothetical protein I7I53_06062 [Histoplasma capsulatum var. duboisii H88]|uniref:Uncharacterized protein n=1 Tax=Ajellomyces capsulatus (strain H88) TaxID=544711 RepID=A0A8A1LE08_AJEC8|nr:hypothetical protein I7I53_06062 [Histoplasma capsulatum var. duboisii H88]